METRTPFGQAGTGEKIKKKVVSKPQTIDKSTWDLKIKVSQKTIDHIKSLGMTHALATAKGALAASKDDSTAKEWVEGVRRLYGDQRFKAAVGTSPTPATRTPFGQAGTATKTAPRGAVTAIKAESSRKPLPKAVTEKFKENNKQKFTPTNSRISGGTISGRDTTSKIKDTESNKFVRNTAASFVAGALLSAAGRKVILPAVMTAKAAKELAANAGTVTTALKGAEKVAKVTPKVIKKPVAKIVKPAAKTTTKVGTESEYSRQADINAARKVIQARMAQKKIIKKSGGK